MGERQPIGIINTEKREVVSVDELVNRYFPSGRLISRKDMVEIRKTAFNIYCRRKEQGYGEIQDPDRNWRNAMRVVAIRKYLKEQHGQT